MDNHVIATLPNEAEDLALHVQLCEQRYLQLLSKFNEVDSKLNEVNTTLTEISVTLSKEKSDANKQHMAIAISIILAMAGWILHLLTK